MGATTSPSLQWSLLVAFVGVVNLALWGTILATGLLGDDPSPPRLIFAAVMVVGAVWWVVVAVRAFRRRATARPGASRDGR